VLIDVATIKGKGVPYAEKDPSSFHGVGKFDPSTGEIYKKEGRPIFSEVIGKNICELAKTDKKIVAVTAAMADGTGLSEFSNKYPERFFDVGIAEQHAVTFSAGLAKMGYKPVFAVYSTFLQRAYDQLLHDVCLQNVGVTLAIDRAGVVGADGKTHQGVFDIAYLNHMPNMTIMAPKNSSEVRKMLKIASDMETPAAIRYPKEECRNESDCVVEYGKAQVYKVGVEIAIVTEGTMFYVGKEICEELEKKGFYPMLVNFPFIKPLDEDAVKEICTRCGKIYTIEDGVLKGGFGESFAALAKEFTYSKVRNFGMPDKFIEHGSREEIFGRYGLTSGAIIERILKENGGN